jgi:hypothetical protein
MSEEKWTQVAVIQSDLQAELLRGLLEAQGIPVLLSQEGAGRAIGLTFGPMGEVRILVPGSQLSRAQSILAAYEAGTFEDMVDEQDLDE